MIKIDVLKLDQPQAFVIAELRQLFREQAQKFRLLDVGKGQLMLDMQMTLTPDQVTNIFVNNINQNWLGCTAVVTTDKKANERRMVVSYPVKGKNVKAKAA